MGELTMGCCEEQSIFQVGQKAPEFEAEAYIAGQTKRIKSGDYKGKWIVLFFYPKDFTFVCPTEIKGFQNAEAEFKKLNAVVIGCSTDSVEYHKAWFERDLSGVKYPILADKTHRISYDYGVLLQDKGIALRGTFIIDPDGVLQYQLVSSLDVGRSISETLRVLSALQTGGLCPVEWKPGMDTLHPK